MICYRQVRNLASCRGTPFSCPTNSPRSLLIRSRYSGCPAPIVPLFPPEDSRPASALKCTPPPSTLSSRPLPSSRSPPRRRYASLTFSNLMVVGHRLDCYSLLSVVFTVFIGHPGHGSLAQDIPQSLHAHLSRCASLQLGPLCRPARQGVTLRRQFAISFSHRSPRFFFALHCFRVSRLPGSPQRGSWSFVSKGVEGKSRRRYIRTNILYPHPLPQPPLYPTHLRLLPSPSPRPPITIHQVADCLFISLFVSNCCHLSCAGPHHNLGRPYTLRDSRARNNRRKRYSKHLSFVATPTLPPPPRDDGLFILLSAALKASDTSLYQVFPLTIVTSCIFFPRSSCSIIWSPLAVSGLPARTRTPLHVKRPHLPLHGLFLFVFVCRGLGLFYLSGVRCWLCCK